jgi:hypothetical protein
MIVQTLNLHSRVELPDSPPVLLKGITLHRVKELSNGKLDLNTKTEAT